MSIAITHLHARYMKPVAKNISVNTVASQILEISLKHLLIQGAVPYDEAVHQDNNDFQGAYRCDIVIVAQPANGVASINAFLNGFEYYSNPGFVGHDSITYKLVSALGQESDAKCIHIFVHS